MEAELRAARLVAAGHPGCWRPCVCTRRGPSHFHVAVFTDVDMYKKPRARLVSKPVLHKQLTLRLLAAPREKLAELIAELI